MDVYVVMSSDFPDCVFADEGAAKRYMVERNTEELELLKLPIQNRPRGRIYWNVYEFEVK